MVTLMVSAATLILSVCILFVIEALRWKSESTPTQEITHVTVEINILASQLKSILEESNDTE